MVIGLEPGGRGMDKQASLDVQCVSFLGLLQPSSTNWVA